LPHFVKYATLVPDKGTCAVGTTSVYVADMEEVRAMLWLLAVHVFLPLLVNVLAGLIVYQVVRCVERTKKGRHRHK